MMQRATGHRRPRSHADPHRPNPLRACLCDGGPLLVATFRDQQVVRLARERRRYCPTPNRELMIDAYLAGAGEVPL